VPIKEAQPSVHASSEHEGKALYSRDASGMEAYARLFVADEQLVCGGTHVCGADAVEDARRVA
jgi:hypothetical protein